MENKILEQPKWKLTQILQELEQAGLPEPSIKESKMFKCVAVWKDTDKDLNLYLKHDGTYILDDDLTNTTILWGEPFRIVIEKLKELLK